MRISGLEEFVAEKVLQGFGVDRTGNLAGLVPDLMWIESPELQVVRRLRSCHCDLLTIAVIVANAMKVM